MKNYFHEKEILNPRAATKPIFNDKGRLIAEEQLDIRLIFEPANDVDRNDNTDFISHMAGAPADSGGRFIIETGADEITWGYGMNTRRTSTYGGEVVQILSTYADKMVITGHCQNYKKQREIYNYFKRYIGWTTGSLGKERRQSFLKFGYPARGWSFIIMVTDIPDLVMSKDTVSPTWTIHAEIVSENDRYSLGQARSNKWSDVLKTPMTASSRKGGIIHSLGGNTDAATRAAKSGTKFQNYNILHKVDPFQDLINQFPDAKRGTIAANFKSLIASWATGDISTLVYNPLAAPAKTAEEIWTSKFGSNIAFTSGGSGTGGTTGDTGNTAINYGQSQEVWATFFGPNDTGTYDDGGYKGDHMDQQENWYSYAELSTNKYNSANGTPADGVSNNYNALGDLPYLTPIKVTYKGKSLVLYKRDVGFGGSKGPKGDRAKIDLWYKAAEELGFTGSDYVQIEIGTPGVNPGSVYANIPTGALYQYPLAIKASSYGGPWAGSHGASGGYGGENWESTHAIDFATEKGTKVVAVCDGTITSTGGNYDNESSGTNGYTIHLSNEDNEFFYQHNSKIYVKEGQKVKQGDVIALSGVGANSAHLHLAMASPINIWDAFGIKPGGSDVWLSNIPKPDTNGLGKKIRASGGVTGNPTKNEGGSTGGGTGGTGGGTGGLPDLIGNIEVLVSGKTHLQVDVSAGKDVSIDMRIDLPDGSSSRWIHLYSDNSGDQEVFMWNAEGGVTRENFSFFRQPRLSGNRIKYQLIFNAAAKTWGDIDGGLIRVKGSYRGTHVSTVAIFKVHNGTVIG